MMATRRWTDPCSRHHDGGNAWTRLGVISLQGLPAVLDAVIRAVAKAGGTLKEQFAIRLALEEAAVNALRHGHKGRTDQVVRICYQLTAGHWLAVVADEGAGFAVERVLKNPGRGIQLMRRYLSWMRYSGTGNRLTLCKYLHASSDDAEPHAAAAHTPLPFHRLRLFDVVPTPATRAATPTPRVFTDALRRGLDLVGALVLLLPALLVVASAAVLIRLTSRGSALYRQTRVGRDGRPFVLYKLRTMRHDCEKQTGAMWSTPGDLRITRIGRLLRRLHIDELPQLWNVLRGEMSLVGPRPERPEFTKTLCLQVPRYGERVAVRPGLTGLAQVQLPPDATVADVRRKVALDLLYVEKRGLWLDVRLLAATGLKLLHVPAGVIRRLCGLPR